MGYRLSASSLLSLVMLVTSLILPPTPGQAELFAPYQAAAERTLGTMSLEEKLCQVLLVRYPGENGISELAQYQFGGYIFFAKDFAGKTPADVQQEMQALQQIAKLPLLLAVDEEGGSVVRVSSNPNLAPSVFRAPRELYQTGGMELIKKDTITKSQVLQKLGINVNLAPVVDVAPDPRDYMYARSLGEDAWHTAEYAATVISASKTEQVAYVLKHFPGYGNNADTHIGTSVDQRTRAEIYQTDLLPFRAGIGAGAEAVLVSHNVVSSIDDHNPASLSPTVHQVLRDDLGFSGVIITDDIAMGALSELPNTTVQAILAGNDLIITTDYQNSFAELKQALAEGTLSEEQLDQAVKRVLAWKYYRGMINNSIE